jgi:hypothetical protein
LKEAGHQLFTQKFKVAAADAYLSERQIGPVALVKMDVEAHEEPP